MFPGRDRLALRPTRRVCLTSAPCLPPSLQVMYDALKARGIRTALVMFEGEQHGFRQAPNIRWGGGGRPRRPPATKNPACTPGPAAAQPCRTPAASRRMPAAPQPCAPRASSAGRRQRKLAVRLCSATLYCTGCHALPPCLQAGAGWGAVLLRRGAGLQPAHATRLSTHRHRQRRSGAVAAGLQRGRAAAARLQLGRRGWPAMRSDRCCPRGLELNKQSARQII